MGVPSDGGEGRREDVAGSCVSVVCVGGEDYRRGSGVDCAGVFVGADVEDGIALVRCVLNANIAVIVLRNRTACKLRNGLEDAGVASIDCRRSGFEVKVIVREVYKLRIDGQIAVLRTHIDTVGTKERPACVIENVVVEDRLARFGHRSEPVAVDRRIRGRATEHVVNKNAGRIDDSIGIWRRINLRDCNALAITRVRLARIIHDGVIGKDKRQSRSRLGIALEGDGSSAATRLIVVDQILQNGGAFAELKVDGAAAAAGRGVIPDDVVFDERGSSPDRDSGSSVAACIFES